MQVTVRIPVALLQYTKDKSEVEMDANTVGERLNNLDQLFPGLRAFIVDDGAESWTEISAGKRFRFSAGGAPT